MSHTGGGPERGREPRWTGWAVAAGLLVLGLGILGQHRTIDIDLFHEMALIREALRLGTLPAHDPFSYTSTVSPVVHHEWGTGAVLYLVVVGLGLGAHGLALLRLLLVAATAAFTIAVARRRGAGWPELAVLAPPALLLFSPGLSPVRAHLFTFLLVAALLWLLEREREGDPKWLLLWPPLFVAWLNLHGGFVVGLGLLGLHAAERLAAEARTALQGGADTSAAIRTALRRTGPLLLSLAAAPLLLLVNPYGGAYIPYLWHGLTMDRPGMTEWYPLWDPVFGGAPLVLFAVSILVAGYAIGRGDGRRDGIPILAATALAALGSARLLPIYAVAWLAYTPPTLSTTPLATVTRRLWQRWARPVAVVVLIAASLGLVRLVRTDAFTVFLPTEPHEHRVPFPAGAVRYLEAAGFRGNLMTPFGVGAYVSWELYPAVRVGMDSRYEVAYAPELVGEVRRLYRGEIDWRSFLERHPTDAVLVPTGTALDSLVTGDRAPEGGRRLEWLEVYRDDAYAVYARRGLAARLPQADRTGRPIVRRFP